ncbi:MAG: hypothetical protein ACK46G_03865 [Flavobacteriales bacterium]|jgi:hypothetical protein
MQPPGDAKIGNFALDLWVRKLLHMATDKAFRTMNELVSALAKAERELGQGALGLEGLEQACGDARELYERLVILRHKAREAAVQIAPAPPASPKKEEAPPVAAEPPPMRLDTRPPETTPRQVSLIEAIEATEQVPEAAAPATLPSVEPPKGSMPTDPVSEVPARSPTSATTLAEKLERASILDLSKAISLSHKFWFVAELFNGDRINYDKTIDRLNTLASHTEAQAFLQAEVLGKLKKPADPEALATFQELIKRRYA